jgi:hypothetical protein
MAFQSLSESRTAFSRLPFMKIGWCELATSISTGCTVLIQRLASLGQVEAAGQRWFFSMRTVWTTSNGYDGPQASPVRPAATMMAGDWVMGASSVLDAATAPQ